MIENGRLVDFAQKNGHFKKIAYNLIENGRLIDFAQKNGRFKKNCIEFDRK
jgi:hypothetical protein